MMQSKASKDLSRGFQTSSEINFLISARKALPTSSQTIDVTFESKILWELGWPTGCQMRDSHDSYAAPSRQATKLTTKIFMIPHTRTS